MTTPHRTVAAARLVMAIRPTQLAARLNYDPRAGAIEPGGSAAVLAKIAGVLKCSPGDLTATPTQ